MVQEVLADLKMFARCSQRCLQTSVRRMFEDIYREMFVTRLKMFTEKCLQTNISKMSVKMFAEKCLKMFADNSSQKCLQKNFVGCLQRNVCQMFEDV